MIDKKRRWDLLAILVIAAVIRFIFLSDKPPHADEGVNGWFADQISNSGFYKYDPTNFHGPLPIYLLHLFQKIFGREIWALRAVGVLFGLLTVWLTTRFEKFWGRKAAMMAALFVALSPAMVFYSRGTVHEPELLFFMVMCIFGFFDKSPWIFFMGLAGALVTKETWSVTFLAFALAALFSKTFEFKTITLKKLQTLINPFLTMVLIVVVFYSGFNKDPNGVGNFFKAYLPWLHTAHSGQGHEKPFYYWLSLMWRYEVIALLGLLLSVKYIFDGNRDKKTLAYFAIIQFLIYTVIPYKTPWCILQIAWPLFFIAAFSFEKKAVLLSAFLIFPLAQTIHLNYFHASDENEPYVYVQTYNEFNKVAEFIKNEAKKNPEILKAQLLVEMGNPWPLPWVFGDFKNSAYYSEKSTRNIASEAAAPAVVFVDADKAQGLEMTLKDEYFSYKFKVRPAMGEVVVYFSKKMFHNELK